MTDNTNLSEILSEFKQISQKLSRIESLLVDYLHLTPNSAEDVVSSLITQEKDKDATLPSSIEVMELQEGRPGIFTTFKALQKADGWVTSNMIAEVTQRSRGLESRYLNFLAEKNFIFKKRAKKDATDKATEVWYKAKGGDSNEDN